MRSLAAIASINASRKKIEPTNGVITPDGVPAGGTSSPSPPNPLILKINVGGTRFMLLRSSLKAYPDTVLGKLAMMPVEKVAKYNLYDAYIEENSEIFFNRPAALFTPIAQFYQTGNIHALPGVCPIALRDELAFWGIYPKYTTAYCRGCLQMHRGGGFHRNSVSSSIHGGARDLGTNTPSSGEHPHENVNYYANNNNNCINGSVENSGNKKLNRILNERKSIGGPGVPLPNGSAIGMDNRMGMSRKASQFDIITAEEDDKKPSFRQWMWNLCEGSAGGRCGMFFNIISISFILMNICLIILDSMEGYHWSDYANYIIYNVIPHDLNTNGTANATEIYRYPIATLSDVFVHTHMSPTSVLFLYGLDWSCTIAFTLEFLIKFWSAPSRCQLMKQPMTIIDLLAMLPAYVETIANLMNINHGGGLSVLQVMRVFRALRVFRIMKLARYESSFKVLGSCLQDCIPEFVLLFVYLFMATLLFGTMLFYAEGHVEHSPYNSIPEAVWWSIVTYFSFADAPPKSTPGKFVAAAASIAGVVLMALPVSVIVDKFSTFLGEFRRKKAEKLLLRSNSVAKLDPNAMNT